MSNIAISILEICDDKILRLIVINKKILLYNFNFLLLDTFLNKLFPFVNIDLEMMVVLAKYFNQSFLHVYTAKLCNYLQLIT